MTTTSPHCHRPPGAARGPPAGTGDREPLVVDRRGGLPGRLRLRAPPGRAPGRRHPGHQDLPLPRPAPLPEPGRVHVGPHGGAGHRHPRVHRLPAPDGPVLRRLPPARRPGLGGPASLARLHPHGRRRRRPLPVAHPRPARAGADGGRAGLHAVALLPAVRRADLGDPAALGRPPLHAGADHRGAAPRRLARAGALRRRGGARERHQRQLHHLRRRGPDPLDPLRRRRPAGVDVAPRPRHRAAHRRPDAGRLPVVDGGPGGGGGLRRQRPEVHRDGPLDVGHLQRGGHHPGPRLLVLLRLRPPRPVDDGRRPLHPGHLAPGDVVRRARPGPGGGRVRALARARLLPRCCSSSG